MDLCTPLVVDAEEVHLERPRRTPTAGQLRTALAMVLIVTMIAVSFTMSGARPAAAEVEDLITQRLTVPDGTYKDDAVSIDLDGSSIGWAETYTSVPDQYWVLDRQGHADEAPDPLLRELKAPGIPTGWHGKSEISGDGRHFTATYRSEDIYDFGAGCNAVFDPDTGLRDPNVGIQYWNQQIIKWSRSSPDGEFDDPELISRSDQPISAGCDDDAVPPSNPDGPPLMGRGANDYSSQPSISDDGSVIAFTSEATDLDGAPLTSGPSAVYVWREGVGVEMLTHPLDGDASEPAVSGNGKAIVFSSDATNVVSGPNAPSGGTSIYIARFDDGTSEWTIELVSTNAAGDPAMIGNNPATSTKPAVDGTGERVAFLSDADNIESLVDPPSEGPQLVIRDFSPPGRTRVVRNQKVIPNLQAHHLGEQPGTPELSVDGERVAIVGRSTFPAPDPADPPKQEDQLLVFKVDEVLDTTLLLRSEARIGRRAYNPGSNSLKRVSMTGASAHYLLAFGTNQAPEDRYEHSGSGIYLAKSSATGPNISRGWHGDPVDTANGNFVHHETDLAAPPGAGPATLERTYSSYGETSGTFGAGWMSTIDTRLEIGTYYGAVTLITPDGQRLSFTSDDDNPGSGPWVASGPTRDTLVQTVAGDWEVTSPDGTVRTFDTSGRLIAIATPGQPEVTIAWNAEPPHQPLSITSTTGYSVTFEDWSYQWVWNEVTEQHEYVLDPETPDGEVDRATTSDGRQVDYTWEWGVLVGASRPHAVGQPAGTYGTRTYEFEDQLMSRIVDQVDATRTKVIVENTYDTEGRVREQTTDTGDVLTFAYHQRPGLGGLVRAEGYTTVTNAASGDVTVYQYNQYNEVIGVTDALGNTVNRTWVGDQPDTSASRSGVATEHIYDDAGRLVETTQTAGASTRTIETLTYVVPDSSPAALTDDRVATRTDESGVTTTFTYNGTAREPATVSVPCDPDSTDAATPCPGSGLATTTYTYHSGPLAGLVALVTDPDGVVTEYTYAADRTLETATSFDGTTPLVTTYDTIRAGDPGWVAPVPAAVEVRTTETPGGAVTTEIYDAEGRLIETRDPLYDGTTHLATTYTYGLDGELASMTDPAGRVTNYATLRPSDAGWNEGPSIGQIDIVIGPDGIGTLTKVDRSGDVVEEQHGNPFVPAEMATTTHTYGPLGRLESTTDPMGVTTSYEYDVEGRVTDVVDEDGNRTQTAYDAFGRPTVVTDPLGQTTTTTYDLAGRVAAVEDREGHDTTYTYDDAGRLHITTDARGGITEQHYTPAGRLAAETDATDRTTRYRYDTAGRQVEVELPSGATTTTAYDAEGRVATVTSPEGRVTSTTYDDLGRQLTVTEPATGTTTFTYWPTGEVKTRTDATGGEVEYTYDGGGRVETVTDPLERTTTYTYDSRGNRTKRIDALLGEREWHWNLGDQLTAEVDPLDRATTYTYDSLGRLDVRTDGAGRTEDRGYDAAGQVTSLTYASGPATTFEYDDEGRRTRMVDSTGTTVWHYNATGQMTGADLPGARDLGFAWDLAGRRTVITYPDGARYRNRYDTDGRLGEVEFDDNGTWVDVAVNDYDEDGLIVEQDQGGSGLREWTHDPVTGRMAAYAETRNGTTTATNLTHDAAGRIATETTGGTATIYDYDDAGQLVGVDRSTGDDETYAYDELGRRSTAAVGATTTTYQWDAASQLNRRVVNGSNHNYQYDASGRRTREAWAGGSHVLQWFWGARGTMTGQRYTAPGTVTDTGRTTRGDGTLAGLTTTVNGTPADTTSIVWDPTLAIPQPVWTGDPGTANATRAVYGPDLIRFTCPTGTSCTGPAHHDHHGSALETPATADITQDTAYTPWGDGGSTYTEGADYGYRSELHTGATIHLRARDYDPDTGLFLSPDPLDGIDGTTTINNPYHYTDNDPINFVDPTGLRPEDDDLAVRQCSDLMPLLFGGESLWEGEGACFITPLGLDLNDPCLDNSLMQNTADHAYGVLNGILLGQASHVVDNSGVCQDGIEVFLGEIVGSSLTLGMATQGAKTAGTKALARLRSRPPGSPWNLGNFARGFAIEEKLYPASALLARNFPKIDRYANGVATSIKSVDLTATSYQSTSALTRKLTGYVDEMANLNGRVLRGKTRSGARITIDTATLAGKELVVAIEPGVASLAQRQAIRTITQQAKGKGVDVVLRTVR